MPKQSEMIFSGKGSCLLRRAPGLNALSEGGGMEGYARMDVRRDS